MENLRSKLSMLNGETSSLDVQKTFKEISKELFKNYHILRGTQEYYFINIEFYFFNKNHLDLITYPRQTKEGLWFFHQSGVDLTFRSDYSTYNGNQLAIDTNKDFYFGGILVREIMKKNSDEVFDGPFKCEWELFDKFNAFTPTIHEMPIIVHNTNEIAIEPIASSRHFSYANDADKIRKKFEELKKNCFCTGNLPLSLDSFSDFIREKEYAYKIKKEDLKSKLTSK